MSRAQTTIVVVPRERFSETRPSLEALFRLTDEPFELVYVAGRVPARVSAYLQVEAQRRGFKLIRAEHFLSPNQARNLALREVTTKYVVFLDNDAVVTSGWLGALVRCAEETGAWVVGPVYGIGQLELQIVHTAGGDAHITHAPSGRHFHEKHRFPGKRLADVRACLQRGPTELAEFHCMLVATEAFERLGPLDEGLLSTAEHVDLCLSIREAGHQVYLEPAVFVSYVAPPPFAWSDLPYYLLRWSDAWNRASLRRFQEKWGLAPDDPHLAKHYKWLTLHRELSLRPIRTLLHRVFGWRLGSRIERALDGALYRYASRHAYNEHNDQARTGAAARLSARRGQT